MYRNSVSILRHVQEQCFNTFEVVMHTREEFSELEDILTTFIWDLVSIKVVVPFSIQFPATRSAEHIDPSGLSY